MRLPQQGQPPGGVPTVRRGIARLHHGADIERRVAATK
jgi:hypothetical protein